MTTSVPTRLATPPVRLSSTGFGALNALDESQFDLDRTANHLVRWLESFELYLRRKFLSSRLPEVMEVPFVTQLENFVGSDDEEHRRPSLQRGALRLLTEFRQQRNEVDLLWQRLSPEVLDEKSVDVIARWGAAAK